MMSEKFAETLCLYMLITFHTFAMNSSARRLADHRRGHCGWENRAKICFLGQCKI